MAREITYLDAIREALREEMRRDPQVFVLGEDVGAYGGAFGITKGLQEEFGEYRCLDMPISESCIIGVSVGASLRGFRPVAEMQFGDFITCGFDQIVNQAATLRYRYGGRVACPIVVRAPVGGNVAGGLYHSQNPESWFVHRPGLKVVAPSTAWDAKGLLKAAIRDNNPVIYLEHKYLYRRAKGPVPEGDEIVPIGEAAVRRDGSDITLVTYGAMVMASLEAADRLSKEGVDVEVIDLRSLSPWDKGAVLASLEKTNRLVVVHEDVKTLGLGAEIAAVAMEERFEHLDAPVMRVTYPDSHCPFSAVLERENLPNADKIADALRKLAAYQATRRGHPQPDCGSCPGRFHPCSAELRLSCLRSDGKRPGHPQPEVRLAAARGFSPRGTEPRAGPRAIRRVRGGRSGSRLRVPSRARRAGCRAAAGRPFRRGSVSARSRARG